MQGTLYEAEGPWRGQVCQCQHWMFGTDGVPLQGQACSEGFASDMSLMVCQRTETLMRFTSAGDTDGVPAQETLMMFASA